MLLKELSLLCSDLILDLLRIYLLHVRGLLPVIDLDVGERCQAVLESVAGVTGRVPVTLCIGLCDAENEENEERGQMTNGGGKSGRGYLHLCPLSGSLNSQVCIHCLGPF